MLETSARLLRLLGLFQRQRYWSGPNLSARLEITSRTLRRDVDKLRSLGYPIHSTSGTEGGYQLGAGSTMPPLLLDDEEAVAVALGLRTAATGAIQGIEEASVRALSKMEQIMPARLARRVAAIQTVVVTTDACSAPVDAGALSIIAGACRDEECLTFQYRDHGRNSSVRSVEPYRLVHTGRRWYLVAWDRRREDWRTFRADRIEPKLSAGVRFVPRDPPASDLAAYVSKGIWNAPPCRARVRLLQPAEAAARCLPPFIGTLEPCDNKSCFLEMGASTWDSLAMYLALLGMDFEISQPAALKESIRRLGERYLKASDS